VSKQCELNSSIVQDQNLSQKFHLIDVNQQCVVAYKQNVQYVIFNYVCNEMMTLQNMKVLCKDLIMSEALIHEKHRLSKIIKNAMMFKKMFDERYKLITSSQVLEFESSI